MIRVLLVTSLLVFGSNVFAHYSEDIKNIYNIARLPNEIANSEPSDSVTNTRVNSVKTKTDVGMSSNEIADKLCKNMSQENILFLNQDQVKKQITAEEIAFLVKYNRSDGFINNCKQGFMDGYSAYLRESARHNLKSHMDLDKYLQHLKKDPSISKSKEFCDEKFNFRKLDTNLTSEKFVESFINLDSRHKGCLRGITFQNSTEVLRLINELKKKIEEEQQ